MGRQTGTQSVRRVWPLHPVPPVQRHGNEKVQIYPLLAVRPLPSYNMLSKANLPEIEERKSVGTDPAGSTYADKTIKQRPLIITRQKTSR